MHDNTTTRLFIGENFRYDGIYYPAILVKNGSSKYVPISFNRDKGTVKYDSILYKDGYGNQKIISRPKSFVTSGAWEGDVSIDIVTRSLRARDDLVELVAMYFTEIAFDTLYEIGIIAKPISISGPSESEDRNDKLFKQSLNISIRTEWSREIPISSIIDTITFAVDFVDLNNSATAGKNLTINTLTSILDYL